MTSKSENSSSQGKAVGFLRLVRRLDLLWLCFVATVNLNLLPSFTSNSGILSLFFLVTVMFVIPQAVAVVEVSRRFPGEGGMVDWAETHFGRGVAFSSTYCYWVNNVLYVPTLIVFVVDLLFQLFQLPQSNATACVAALALLGVVGAFSILGLGASRRLVSLGGLCTVTAVVMLIGLCCYGMRHGQAIIPSGTTLFSLNLSGLTVFGAACMGMIGSELGTVVGDEVEETTASVAWATWRILVSAGVCYLLGSLALLLIAPQGTLDPEGGILQTIMNLSWARQFHWLPFVLGGLLSVSVLAASIAWFDAGSRTLWRGADEKWISARFSELHPRLSTPVRASILQAAFSSIVLALCYSGNRGKDVYLFMLSLSVVSQLVPFVIMFLGLRQADSAATSNQNLRRQIWGGLGGFSCAAGIVLSFIAPGSESSLLHAPKMLLGISCFALLGWIVYRCGRQY